jgi:hypothetical protein
MHAAMLSCVREPVSWGVGQLAPDLEQVDVSGILGYLRVPAEIRQELMNMVRVSFSTCSRRALAATSARKSAIRCGDGDRLAGLADHSRLPGSTKPLL